MGFNLPAPTIGAGAPDVGDGLAVVRFDDITLRTVEQFVTASDKYGKADDGRRLEFGFTLLDERQEVVYDEEGDPIELRNAKSCKPGATGEKSNFRAYLAGLLKPTELAAWEASSEDEPFDASTVPGRILDVQISHSKSGWPQVETIIGIAKPPKGAK